MLEIREHYVLDATGVPIAIQIPIEQFEALLDMLHDGLCGDDWVENGASSVGDDWGCGGAGVILF